MTLMNVSPNPTNRPVNRRRPSAAATPRIERHDRQGARGQDRQDPGDEREREDGEHRWSRRLRRRG